MSKHSTVLVVNYVMDPENPLLSHQLEAVSALAGQFSRVIVITGKVGKFEAPDNVVVLNSNWIPGKPFSNFIRLLRISFPLIIKGKFDSAFFHMTDLQCAILAPIIRLRGKKQVLWYAHTKKSIYLRWSFPWVNFVVTSTYGSCPLTGKKVVPIGQAIDSEKFREIPVAKLDFNKLVHIGRFDRSKNIGLLIQQARELRKDFANLTLSIVGHPANSESKVWADNLVKSSEQDVRKGWLTFSESIPRALIPSTMASFGCFFHAYLGSLDKTLVEATMLNVPVVSVNPEYLSIFGQWSLSKGPNLSAEYRAFRQLPFEEIAIELQRRRMIALDNHSLKNWVSQLAALLE